jgi:serine phosphatase RsbU (regulator of sigma subunit)
MTRLRYCARTLAAAGANPAQVISQLNRIMHTGHPDAAELATVVHAQLDLTRQALTYSNAGHLPLIIFAPDAEHGPSPALHAHPLPLLGDPPVGVIADLQYTEHCAHVNTHSVLIGFTDGLIERGHQDIDQALDALLDSLNRLPRRSPPTPKHWPPTS